MYARFRVSAEGQEVRYLVSVARDILSSPHQTHPISSDTSILRLRLRLGFDTTMCSNLFSRLTVLNSSTPYKRPCYHLIPELSGTSLD